MKKINPRPFVLLSDVESQFRRHLEQQRAQMLRVSLPTHRKLPAASAGLNPRQVAAQHLRREGYSLSAIAGALGVSKTHVARLCAMKGGA